MLVFCHIPKTAGTTLNALLRRHFGSKVLAARARRGDVYTERALEVDLRIYPDVQVLSGHTLRPWVEFGARAERMRWFTLLRSPRSTLVSLYVHQFTSTLPEHDRFKRPFHEWLEAFGRRNRQTKWIAGAVDVEAAKRLLRERFAFVGVTERFDEALLLLRRQLELPSLDLRYERKMVARDSWLADEVRAMIDTDPERYQPYLGVDEELYRFAMEELYPGYVEAFGGVETLAKAVEALREEREGYREPFLDRGLIAYRIKNNLFYKPYTRFVR